MFAKWRAKRETKRIQAHCPHEWHIVSEYRKYANYEMHYLCDIYCPACDRYVKGADQREAYAILQAQEIRKQYEEGGR